MKIAITAIIAMWLWTVPLCGAETIYTWTDSNGVQRYSNQQPPEGITDYKKIESSAPSSVDPNANEKNRKSYDHMIEEVRQESQQRELKRRQEDAERAKIEKQKAEADKKARIQAKREILEKKIKDLENRALSPTYSAGMRQAQIDEIRNQIEKLEESANSKSGN